MAFVVVVESGRSRVYVGPFQERVDAELYAEGQSPVDFPENNTQVEVLHPPKGVKDEEQVPLS